MQFAIERAPLAQALSLAASIIPTRTPQATWRGVEIVADEDADTVTLRATSGVDVIVQTIAASVKHDGRCILPADRLIAAVKASTDDAITFRLDGETAKIASASARWQLHTIAGELPGTPTFERVGGGSINAGRLASALSVASAFMATEDGRYTINGVLLTDAHIVATDGRRLCVVDLESPLPGGILPAHAVRSIQRWAAQLAKDAGDGDQPVIDLHPSEDASCIAFVCGGASIVARLTEGSFPAWKDVIPKGADLTAEVDAATLEQALRQADVTTDDDSKGVRITLAAGVGTMDLSSRSPEQGQAEITIDLASDARGTLADPIAFGVNPGYLRDAIRGSDGTVEIEVTAPNRPIVVRYPSVTCVVMPVSLN